MKVGRRALSLTDLLRPVLKPDIVVSSGADGKVRWFRSKGYGNGYESVVVTDAAPGASSVTVGDIDGDGIDDIVASSATDNTVRWFKHTPTTLKAGSCAPGETSGRRRSSSLFVCSLHDA